MPFKSPLPPVPLETQPYGERMLDVLWRHGAANPTKKAMICAENPQFSVTYHELYHGSLSVAAFLETQGFKKGDVLLTVLPNSWEMFEVTIGAALRGIIVTGVSMLFTEYETRKQIQDSGAIIIFCSDDRLELVSKAIKNIDHVKKLVVAQLSDRTKQLPTNLPTGITRFEDVLATKPGEPFAAVKIDVKQDVLLLPYSSGTTGPRKGVMISHELFSTMITTISSHFKKNMYPYLNPHREVASEHILLDLPISHIYGGAMLQKAMLLGQTAVLMQNYEEHCYLRSIQNFKVHFLFLKPTVIVMLANSPNVDKYDLSSVEGGLSSGAPASVDICYKALKRLPNLKRIDQGYGMTETSGACTLPIIDKTNPVTTYSGVISPNYEMKLVDSESREVPFGESGELLLRAPAMMLGYLGRLEATANAFADGWFKTGDIARIDENGLVYIVGRLKEMIKSQSLQVSPTELEDVLHSHPEIADAGVIGIPWNDSDEAPFAFIVRKNNNLSKEEINKFVNGKVAEYKRLRGGIKFVDAIPKSDAGKILRNVLKEMHDNGK
uniref:AMP-binding domain-containing protein n=1 Tax=Panagrellus redivivus TaxID=6233 RepID=A0A7E4W4G4_PANRE